MRDSYLAAFSIVDNIVTAFGLNDNRPPLLHHYTSMDVGHRVLTGWDIRLSHCEYLNDAQEIKESITTIRAVLHRLIQAAVLDLRVQNFYNDILRGFDARAQIYEAFVFCMSEGDLTKPFPQDVLSSWRAYGREGRGICLSFDSPTLANVNNQQTTECRLSRVIYDDQLQERLIAKTVDEGLKYFNRATRPNDAVEAAIVALIFMMPTMKHHAFSEEREWRLIYVPQPTDPVLSKRAFHPGPGGLLIPFFSLNDVLGYTTRQALPIQEIMVGPSPYQELNLRALEFLRNGATTRNSVIPYRTP